MFIGVDNLLNSLAISQRFDCNLFFLLSSELFDSQR